MRKEPGLAPRGSELLKLSAPMQNESNERFHIALKKSHQATWGHSFLISAQS